MTLGLFAWLSVFDLAWAKDCPDSTQRATFPWQNQSLQIAKTEISAKSFWLVARRENWSVPEDFVREFVLEGQLQRPCRPATQINWEWSQRYCKSQGGRLPSAEEWIAAANAQTVIMVTSPLADLNVDVDQEKNEPNSLEFEDLEDADFTNLFDEVDELLQEENPQEQRGDPETELQDVDQALRSENKLVGMKGNVWEWVLDDYNPENAEIAHYKQIRGGSYLNADLVDDENRRITWEPEFKGFAQPQEGYRHVGFRCIWINPEAEQ